MEEFEEFDVLFSENPQQHEKKKKKNNTGLDSMKVYPEIDFQLHSNEEEEKKRRKKMISISVPMRIPSEILTSRNSILNRMESDYTNYDIFDEDEDEEEEGRKRGGGILFVPPHLLMVDRRRKQRMAFSVCTGNGRTLKGRDLSRVRNSVLRMTGFIETC